MGKNKIIEKRIPSNTLMEQTTFLNDKKIDGELYGYFQSISESCCTGSDTEGKPVYRTVVYKNKMDTQENICKKINIGSPKTYRAHLKYLIERGFIEESQLSPEIAYELPMLEELFFMIPLDTLRFLVNNCRDHVIKIYAYLGTLYMKEQKECTFTLSNLGLHVGLKVKNYSYGYAIINDALDLLKNNGLIDFVQYNEGAVIITKLTKFSKTYIKSTTRR